MVANLVTQPGETDGFDLARHVEADARPRRARRLDFVLVHDGPIPAAAEERYRASGADVLRLPGGGLQLGAKLVRADLVSRTDGRLRHHSSRLAEALRRICAGELERGATWLSMAADLGPSTAQTRSSTSRDGTEAGRDGRACAMGLKSYVTSRSTASSRTARA